MEQILESGEVQENDWEIGNIDCGDTKILY